MSYFCYVKLDKLKWCGHKIPDSWCNILREVPIKFQRNSAPSISTVCVRIRGQLNLNIRSLEDRREGPPKNSTTPKVYETVHNIVLDDRPVQLLNSWNRVVHLARWIRDAKALWVLHLERAVLAKFELFDSSLQMIHMSTSTPQWVKATVSAPMERVLGS